MARPEHNTYDFPDDIITIYDVDDDLETLSLFHLGITTKKEYLANIRKHHLGTDAIYAELSAFYLDIDNRLSDYYYNKVSKGYYKTA